MSNIELPKDGKSWWSKLGIKIEPSPKEIERSANNGIDADGCLASQEAMDARRLIQLGLKIKDKEMVDIGRKRMRIVMGKDYDGE